MLRETFMRLPFPTLGALLSFGLVVCAHTQERADHPTAETHRPELTGKERLGPKWTDEQRIDNCHVPIDKRGSKPRPTACQNSPSS